MRAAGQDGVAVAANELVDISLHGLGEGLVLRRKGAALLVPVEEREVDHPEEVVALARNLEHVGHVQAHAAQDLVGLQPARDREEQQVARLSVHLGTQGLDLGLAHELLEGTVPGAVLLEGKPGQALGAEACGDLAQLVDAGAGPGAGALGVDALDVLALGLGRVGEKAEGRALKYRSHVVQGHAEAGVGLVDAVGVHGLPIGHAAQRRGHVHAHLGEGVVEHVLDRGHHIVLLDEAHLHVHLRELGLTVGAQVLVAEALGHLVVALHAADHEELLQELRALRQGVEVARLGA